MRAKRTKRGDRIQAYPVAMACRLDQGNCLATRAQHRRAVGQYECATLRTIRWRMGAVDQFQWADALDEAIRRILVRLPADVIVQRAADALHKRSIAFTLQGQSLRRRFDVRVRGNVAVRSDLLIGPRALRSGGDVQPGQKGLKLCEQRVGEVQNNNAG